MQNPNIFEAGTEVSEAANHGVVELQKFKAGQDFSSYLKVVAQSVNPEFDFSKRRKFINLNATKCHSKEFLIQVDDVFHLVLFYYVKQVVLHVLENNHVFFSDSTWVSWSLQGETSPCTPSS